MPKSRTWSALKAEAARAAFVCICCGKTLEAITETYFSRFYTVRCERCFRYCHDRRTAACKERREASNA
jgi:hypothetical protein